MPHHSYKKCLLTHKDVPITEFHTAMLCTNDISSIFPNEISRDEQLFELYISV